MENRSPAWLGRLQEAVTRGAQGGGTPRRLPAGLRLYAVGDVHGHLDRLDALHERIAADAAARPAERRLLVYLGDYVDRGPDSRGVVERLIEQPLAGFEAVHLLGNHEAFLRRFLAEPEAGGSWLANGGDATLRSYGIDPAGGPQPAAARLDWLSRRFAEALPAAHRRFLDGLRHSFEVGDYLFVHAGVRPGVALEAQDPEDLIWIREPFLRSRAEFGRLVVHGHTPEREPVRRDNRIGIDTGACYGGSLTALVLQGDGQSFLQA